jgi:hypothetical protein
VCVRIDPVVVDCVGVGVGVVCVLGCVGRDEVKEVSTETSQRPWSESVLCLVL